VKLDRGAGLFGLGLLLVAGGFIFVVVSSQELEFAKKSMKAAQTKVGNSDILIEMIDDVDVLEIVGGKAGERLTVKTGIAEQLSEAYGKAKTAIKEIAEDMGQELHRLTATARPKQVDIEFGLGLSAGAGIWIVTGKADGALKVKMSWEFTGNEPR
jgi:hypothetical protein